MENQVEEIKSKIDIVSIISEYLELKKAGRNYKALCPFHSEKTPSFMVSSELQIFKCFGCSKGGDVFTFLQEYEGMDFYEALKFLAGRVGVKLKPIGGEKYSEKEKYFRINSLATRFYEYILLNHSSGKEALNYLKVDRELDINTIKKFHLGFSPNVDFAIRKFLVDKKGFSAEELEKVGLIYLRNGRALDRFRGRVIFPLYDHRDNIVGFAGRLLPGASENLSKYINTPETEIYHKSKILYGLNIARKDIKKDKTVVICEGELDMISSWKAGIKNTVAIKGTALTEEQVRLIERFAETVILSLDADIAGDEAVRRGIEIAQKYNLEIKVAQLIGFKDPDEAARKDPKAYKKAIKNARGVWSFIIHLIFNKNTDKGKPNREKIVREIIPILAKIENEITKSHYINVVAKKLGVSDESVEKEIIKFIKSRFSYTPKVELEKVETGNTRQELLEERLFAIIFRYDPKILESREIDEFIITPLAMKILKEFREFMKKNKDFDPSVFAAVLPKEVSGKFVDLLIKDLDGFEDESKIDLQKELELVKRELKILIIKQKIEQLSRKIKAFEDSGKESEKLKKAQNDFSELTDDLKGFII
ncbi:DNA primase [Candidatus Woesebacteria bacterium RBG_13_34_9]|uniref:DNA primase n=1 Tax=Candidatus Woesebacteria bacterium RBG_13_34_9 TaxID=1802477 RepID=A0A1F7X800_9BACT|nr:MAG: DNA primase [Candidatus Woesebacteria bacterium RBG_13_34_9]